MHHDKPLMKEEKTKQTIAVDVLNVLDDKTKHRDFVWFGVK